MSKCHFIIFMSSKTTHLLFLLSVWFVCVISQVFRTLPYIQKVPGSLLTLDASYPNTVVITTGGVDIWRDLSPNSIDASAGVHLFRTLFILFVEQ